MSERKTVVRSMHANLVPLPYEGTTAMIKDGWAGTRPLPVTVFTDDLGRHACNTAWKIPKAMHKLVMEAMLADRMVISVLVIVGVDGGVAEMSVVVPKVELSGKAS